MKVTVNWVFGLCGLSACDFSAEVCWFHASWAANWKKNKDAQGFSVFVLPQLVCNVCASRVVGEVLYILFPTYFPSHLFFLTPLSITIKLKKVQKIDTVWVTENFLHHFFSPLDPPKSSDLIWRNLNSFWGQHFWVTALDALRRISTFWSPFSKAIYLNFEILSHLSWSLPALLVLLYVFSGVPANLVTKQSKEYFKCRVHTQKSFHWRPANA